MTSIKPGKIPLFDGTTVDIGRSIHPSVDGDEAIVLREDFAREELPWWLSYDTDNGPTEPVIEGLATSDGKTELVLDAGTGAVADDCTVVVGPTINWSNWSEIKIFAWGCTTSNPWDIDLQITLGDARNHANITEGFRIVSHEGGLFSRAITGGSAVNKAAIYTGSYSRADASVPIMTGMHFYHHEDNPESTGHSVNWVTDGMSWDRYAENASGGWPVSQDMEVTFGLRSKRENDNATLRLDGVYIELLP